MLVNFFNKEGNFYEVLGISEERSVELHDHLHTSFIKALKENPDGKLSDILELSLEECETIDEVAYVSFMCGRQIGAIETKSAFLENEKGN